MSHINNDSTIKEKKELNFDSILKEKWEEAQNKGIFRYVLNIKSSKILSGKYQFLAQLNIDRGCNRRLPENITSMTQLFDKERFNFTKISSEEKIMNLDAENEADIIAVNISPLEYCHCLLLPERWKQLPQVVTKYSLYKALDIFALSHDLYIRMVFNSLCAYASVNHLHWHLYYLNHKMLLEYIDLDDFMGPVQILKNYPANGFCIKRLNVKNIDEFVNWAFLVINYLQNKQIAHNVYITRAKADSGKEYEDLRIYIWARKSSTGIKDTSVFNVASCELFGHLSIKSEEVYKNVSEEYVANFFKDITEEPFSLIFDEVKNLIQRQLTI
ncbi:GDP-D-glucose phosphorylase 1 [Nomia melanderi]|uniref:GDP-D-glucose phosphorylase 1 n=1 Tax=Nomia melanderi TaxID=2448451 RepID=UPI001304595E|nr:GDP-D-glucose phosphorylase 1 [Nomia melanderi]